MKYIVFFILIIFLNGCGSENTTILSRDDGAEKLSINLTGSLQNPAFSPDSNSIVFTRFRNGYNKEPADLYTYDLNTKELKILVKDGHGNINLPGSSWNQDYIVYSSTKDPHDEIYKINVNTLEIEQITCRDDKVAYEPSFNKEGSKIVFESHKLDVEENGIITIFDMTNYISITNIDGDARQPNWSPAGDKILFQKFSDNRWDVWIIDEDGANKFQVTDGNGDKTDACFTNNGKNIIFSGNLDTENANIYSINIDNEQTTRLTNYNGYDGAPSVSYDNTKLAFESSSNESPDESSGTSIWIKNL